jgi:hypothetical protein
MPAGAAPSSRGALHRLRLRRAAAREINAHLDPTSGRAVEQGIRGDISRPAPLVAATRRGPRPAQSSESDRARAYDGASHRFVRGAVGLSGVRRERWRV